MQSEAKTNIEKLFIYFFPLSGDMFCSVLFLLGHLTYMPLFRDLFWFTFYCPKLTPFCLDSSLAGMKSEDDSLILDSKCTNESYIMNGYHYIFG